ncbi:hypothetical protein [Achromobacter marplatensis]|jgi:hypothetical protein|uniref:hypothetical protein n=1 Tax=Achromobacter marplatensis TaxID=470868 RepID=UPI003C7546DF
MAEIQINKAQWDEVDADTRQKIVEGFRKVGALRADDKIVAAADVAPFTIDQKLAALQKPLGEGFFQLRDPFRDAACDIAAAGALAWCTANTAGVGYAACVAAAEAARNACKG